MNLSERELFTGILIYKIELTDSFVAVVDVLTTNFNYKLLLLSFYYVFIISQLFYHVL